VSASAIALKKVIRFRILIPSRKVRGYATGFEKTRQNWVRMRNFDGCRGCIALSAHAPNPEISNVTIS
jgi:hypothetical protein